MALPEISTSRGRLQHHRATGSDPPARCGRRGAGRLLCPAETMQFNRGLAECRFARYTDKHEWTPASIILSAAKHPSRSRGRVVQRDSPACGGRRRLALYSPDPSGGGGRSREGNGRSNQNPDAGQSPGLEGTPDRKEPGGKSCCRMVGPRERGHQPSAFSKPTTLPGALLCFLWSICLGALRLFALRPSGTRCGSPSADLRLFASLKDAIFALPRSVRAFARVSIGRSQPLF